MKLDPAVKARWIEALRSGEFPQQRDSALKNDHGYCCLGVLHRIQTGVDPERYWDYRDFDRPKIMFDIEEHIEQLTSLNDHQGKSFAEIADWIEANL